MSATTFNAITYANKLKKAGMETKVADTQAEEMVNIMNSTVATKEDVNKLRNETKEEMGKLRSEMKVMELELKGFIIKALIAVVSVIGGLQAIFRFMG
jgi:hypothetical protein